MYLYTRTPRYAQKFQWPVIFLSFFFPPPKTVSSICYAHRFMGIKEIHGIYKYSMFSKTQNQILVNTHIKVKSKYSTQTTRIRNKNQMGRKQAHPRPLSGPKVNTWKKPQSLQAEWSRSNSEPMESPWSKQWRSMTGTDWSQMSAAAAAAAAIWRSCWLCTYRGGTLVMGSLTSSLTLGTIIDFPNTTWWDSVSITGVQIPLVRLYGTERQSNQTEACFSSLKRFSPVVRLRRPSFCTTFFQKNICKIFRENYQRVG